MKLRLTPLVIVLSVLLLIAGGAIFAGDTCCPKAQQNCCNKQETTATSAAVRTADSGVQYITARVVTPTGATRVIAIPISAFATASQPRVMSAGSCGGAQRACSGSSCSGIPLSQCTPEMKKQCQPGSGCGAGQCGAPSEGCCSTVTKTTETRLDQSI